jgi:membrane protease YdiL (CAAX protease family)
MTQSTAQTLKLSPARARWLVAFTYAALIVGYLLDLALDPRHGGFDLFVSALKLVGLVGCGAIFLTTFSYTANAPDHQIDERERAERNAVYFRAYQVVIGAVFVLFLALIGVRLLSDWTPTVGTLEELLTLIGIGGLALPAALLAWRSSAEDDER